MAVLQVFSFVFFVLFTSCFKYLTTHIFKFWHRLSLNKTLLFNIIITTYICIRGEAAKP